ncbi:glycosyl hydrolase [Paenibacillus sp. IB182496]|uniref:Glycosyl hydrolase n=1 Tax=Paenibacillus sabuli TaxID=2772509 RepID=A0A927GSJ0_9BACL|nr:glycoside hydrolase family 76 protein [Paenibacillus sabuli]MBD2846618.1 glycosyl hydrolase [Paenibacillus sabuli]
MNQARHAHAASIWQARADAAQRTLDEQYWNTGIGMYNIQTPCPNGDCNTIFHYWWMAHAVEALTDALERTGEARYARRLGELYDGLLARNGGVWPNPLYDDMEWMAIGWLRAHRATGEARYQEAALELWADIQTGWNNHMGGGIAWQKSQPDYKNTPANAPAAILAARLYDAFGDPADLAWARRIYAWVRDALVDPQTGFVWDGMNRLQDGAIDKDWRFTYCQGVYIGAALELYRITGEHAYRADAERTWAAALAELTRPGDRLFPYEGTGDGGLFKGILARYAGQLALLPEQDRGVAEVLAANARALWQAAGAAAEDGGDNGGAAGSGALLFGGSWEERPVGDVELSTQLSGVILLETAARLEAAALSEGR